MILEHDKQWFNFYTDDTDLLQQNRRLWDKLFCTLEEAKEYAKEFFLVAIPVKEN